MHFGFALELSNVDLLNIDLLDTHLDFACLHNVFKTSSRHVFKTCLQDMSSRRLQDQQMFAGIVCEYELHGKPIIKK